MIQKLLKTRQAKIALICVAVVAVLTGAYFLTPDAVKYSADTVAAVSGSSALAGSESALSSSGLPEESSAVSKASGSSQAVSFSASSSGLPASSKSSSVSSKSSSAPSISSSTSSQDKYKTDPTPPGKPKPVEPQDTTIDQSKAHTCTLSIRCDTILNNMDKFDKDKLSVLPSDGVIMATKTVTFYENESVFDVLKRETKAAKIQMEFKWTPIYNSVYIEGIHNLYEFDTGDLSGWMYKVDDWFPNYGASRYVLKQGDKIEWVYTCDLGRDVGCEWLGDTHQ